jgi:hypothetical protein
MTLFQKLMMATWLREFLWMWFGTLTFRKSLSARTCHRIFLDWIAALERIEGESIGWARVIEQGKEGRLHIHVLIAGTHHVSLQAAEKLWATLAGEATIGIYDPERRAVEYLLKTMESNEAIDLDFSLIGTPTVYDQPEGRQQDGEER